MLQLDKYKLALAISPVPMLLVARDGEILLANPLLDDLFCYAPGELVGKNVDILVPESVREHHPQLRHAYLKLPSKRQMGQGRDLTGITKTGEVITLELGLDSVEIDGENFALVVALDIRHRKQHERRMNLAMDAAASAMIMVDEKGSIVFVNKAALTLFGYDEKELLGNPIECLVPKDIQRVHPVYLSSFMNSSKARPMAKEQSLHALHRDGRKIPVEIALTPLDTPSGKMVMSTVIDLTERLAAEQAVAAKTEELAMANSELSQFAYSASHDLKAPLSSIAGLLSVCIEDLESGNTEEIRENLEKCLNISRRSANKVEGVLEIAAAGRDDIPSEPIEFERLIQEMWLDLTGVNEKNTRLKLDLQHEEPVVMQLNVLKVIMENLLSNATRYGDETKDEHFIEVRTSSDGERISIAVKDNGIGIPQNKQHVVFDMFKRIDERSGDGLGMALVKKQIDRLGGSISFNSVEGEGTEFNLTLPLSDEH